MDRSPSRNRRSSALDLSTVSTPMNRWSGLLVYVLSTFLAGCASTQKPAAPLTKVKQNGIPGIDGFAAQARQIVQSDYGRVHAILGGDGDATPFSIIFRESI